MTVLSLSKTKSLQLIHVYIKTEMYKDTEVHKLR